MEITLEETERNIRVVTNKDISDTSRVKSLQGAKKVIRTSKYVLAKEMVIASYPSTNGFITSSISLWQDDIIPELVLNSFDLSKDDESQIIMEIKIIFQDAIRFLRKKGVKIHSGSIQEIFLNDNEDSAEIAFNIDILIYDFEEFEDLINLEESLWDFMENADTVTLPNEETVEVMISLSNWMGEED